MAQRALDVFANARRVGELREQEDLWAFEYAPEWIAAHDAFDLSPALPRTLALHRDGASERPVQWYFDNLLPEEQLRTILAKEAQIAAEDAFGLLAYFGAESAGALMLCPAGQPPTAEHGLRALPQSELSRRIDALPRVSLTRAAPKRMSLAGAQHKLLVVIEQGALFEPIGSTASTHILKPNHPEVEYPASVANEYFTMRLAQALRLPVPPVQRWYVPQPVYLIRRFDRAAPAAEEEPVRRHAIDACQLLNKSRAFKYTAAKLDTLAEAVSLCRSRAAARLQVYRWLVFNLLVGNADNHLKNLSFLVEPAGVEIAPVYDLLATAVYDTRALAGDAAPWPRTPLVLPIGNARSFAEVTRAEVLDAGAALGLRRSTAERELDHLLRRLAPAADALIEAMDEEGRAAIARSPDPERAAAFLAGEQRLLAAVRNIVLPEMQRRLA